jgi:hypothetical protein
MKKKVTKKTAAKPEKSYYGLTVNVEREHMQWLAEVSDVSGVPIPTIVTVLLGFGIVRQKREAGE